MCDLACTLFTVILAVNFVQVYAMPVFDMIETQLVKRNIPNGLITRLVYRSLYVGIVGFVGITIPFFGGESQTSELTVTKSLLVPMRRPLRGGGGGGLKGSRATGTFKSESL